MRTTPEQDDLRAAVRSVLARHEGAAAWRPLAEQLGAAALAIPERQGGLGCGLPEIAVVSEELGRALSPTPYLGSAVLAVTALVAADADLAPGLVDGTLIAALAWAEAGGWEPDDLTAHADAGPEGTWRLTGMKEYLLAGPDAPDLVYAFARTPEGRLGLFAVDGPGAEFVALPTLDRTRPLARIVLDRAPARLLTEDGAAVLARVRDVGAVALAAECVGAAERALEITVRYAKDRVQFGRPIGSFQAVKHRLADLHAGVAAARSLALAAAHADGGPESARLAAAAKSACAEAYQRVAAETVQLHGGIGITWEHSAHDHLKRAHGAAALLGSPAAHRARLGGLLGLNAA
ncbi:acyl-CoA dehydrogenase family protein [Streptomyces sp. NPDC048629]|uniref:acyl-CoA dehydrogenase family protein n=1 Tax=Streptomyces sp. NPDC048629 TaxID=3154824 RepID=UPI003427765D